MGSSHPAVVLFYVTQLLIFGSAIVVAVDASRIGARKGLISGFWDLSPVGWFFGVWLLWIVGFPGYLVVRSRIQEAAVARQRFVQAYTGGPTAWAQTSWTPKWQPEWTPPTFCETNYPPATPSVPAAWYPDPVNPGAFRWWDGAAWTDHRTLAD